jgi:hypothetical protein
MRERGVGVGGDAFIASHFHRLGIRSKCDNSSPVCWDVSTETKVLSLSHSLHFF